ncbi:hypothetical protein CFRS1_v006536 [Colletotrichum fructicola]|nr:hypothetical protein CFRS1_v006536 [Colletotrichum fructicola]
MFIANLFRLCGILDFVSLAQRWKAEYLRRGRIVPRVELIVFWSVAVEKVGRHEAHHLKAGAHPLLAATTISATWSTSG